MTKIEATPVVPETKKRANPIALKTGSTSVVPEIGKANYPESRNQKRKPCSRIPEKAHPALAYSEWSADYSLSRAVKS